MAAIDSVSSAVRPLNGAIIRRFLAASAVTVGQAVYIDGNGAIAPADADDVAQSQGRGVVVAVATSGAVSAAAGQMCDVVTHGPVYLGNATAMTEGAVVYVSPTAGAMDHSASATAGDFNYIIGYAEAAQVLYVDPQMVVPTAVPE